MLHDFTITLSDAEKKALEYVAFNANDWIQNAIHERCRLAIEELVSDYISDNLAKGLPISGSKEDMVLNSSLPSAAERHDLSVSQINTMINSQQT